MRKRGSALIIALLIMTTVGGVTFGIGRLFFLNQNILSIYQDSIFAYYAAESGIEEGMLRYRYEKNSEVPDPYNEDEVVRSNISRANTSFATIVEVVNKATNIPTTRLNNQYYDLNMSYLIDIYGDDENKDGNLSQSEFASSNYDEIYVLQRDESAKIDVTNIIKSRSGIDSKSDFTLYVQAVSDSCVSTPSDLYFEAKIISTVLGKLKEIKVVLDPAGEHLFPVGSVVNIGKLNSVEAPPMYILQNTLENIRKSGSSAHFDSNAKTEFYIKPIGCGSKIGLIPTPINKDIKITSPFSTIRSVGHFGGITRTLTANIDRQSGTLYDIYDYVIYQYGNIGGSGEVVPRTTPIDTPAPVSGL